MININARPSYSWCGEDILLYRIFGKKKNGFYFDIGAFDPVHGSVTKIFSDMGWSGINIEPNPELAKKIASNRPNDITLAIGISSVNTLLPFYEIQDEKTLSTFSKDQMQMLEQAGKKIVTRQIETHRLDDICKKYSLDREIDFMVIDVEGFEYEIISSGDWQTYRPSVLVVEATLPKTTIPCHHKWEPILLANGYRFAYFDGFNRYYVKNECHHLVELIGYPPTWLDGFEYHEKLEIIRKGLQYSQLSKYSKHCAHTTECVIGFIKKTLKLMQIR